MRKLAHYCPYDVKLGLLAHSRSFLANQKARNAIVGAENLLNTYILLTKHERRTGRISARALGPYKKDQGPIFSQDGPEQAWLIRDLLHK